MTHIPKRETYEGEGGWKDGRLGQAYDLIDAVMRDWPSESGPREALIVARSAVEGADVEMATPSISKEGV